MKGLLAQGGGKKRKIIENDRNLGLPERRNINSMLFTLIPNFTFVLKYMAFLHTNKAHTLGILILQTEKWKSREILAQLYLFVFISFCTLSRRRLLENDT